MSYRIVTFDRIENNYVVMFLWKKKLIFSLACFYVCHLIARQTSVWYLNTRESVALIFSKFLFSSSLWVIPAKANIHSASETFSLYNASSKLKELSKAIQYTSKWAYVAKWTVDSLRHMIQTLWKWALETSFLLKVTHKLLSAGWKN